MRRALTGRALAAFAITLVAAAGACGATFAGVLDRAEGASVDARFAVRGERVERDMAVVAIDDRTFDTVRRWPFSRRLHARAIDHLRRAGARVIAYDVQFTEPGPSPAADLALYDAVARARPAVLSTTEVDAGGRTSVLGGDENLRAAGARAGNTLLPTGAGGIMRRVPRAVDGLPSFAVRTVEAATGRPVRAIPARGALIDFAGPPGTVPTLSFGDVSRGRFPAAAVRDRIVVVGASAPSLQDVHPTPVSGSELMAGPELQANAIATVLRGLPLREAGTAATVGIVVLAAAVAPLAAVWLSWLGIVLAALLGAAALGGSAAAAFASGLVVPLAAPAVALGLGTLGALGIRVAAEARERRRVRETFGRFVPEAVVSELLGRDAGPRLPPARRDATVLFCDLRGFSAFAERAPVERVLELLDRHLTEMSEAVLAHGGTVVSYAGDGLMAVFGSPVPRDDHARAAYAAACEMLDSRLPRLNAWLAESGEPAFALGVGLNSGPVMTGTVGSDRRLEYAAVGDTTNVAARLEAMTKATGGGLLLSDVTRRDLGEAAAGELEPYGDVVLRGRTEPLGVFRRGEPAAHHWRATTAPAAVSSPGRDLSRAHGS